MKNATKKLYNAEIILQYLHKNNLTKTQFCKRCGISVNTLNRILARSSNMSLRVLIKILNEIKCDSVDFIGVWENPFKSLLNFEEL